MKVNPVLLPVLVLLLFVTGSCTHARKQHVSRKKEFTLPQIPSVLTTPQERAEYLVTHYWTGFDFSDTALIHKPEISEQAFVDFINALPNCSVTTMEKSITSMLDSAMKGDSLMFAYFFKLSEKYFYDPNSPMRNEEFYLPVLKYIISSPKIDETTKIRPQYQLDMLLKNRPGEQAADFTYTLANGRIGEMSAIKAQYTILFFNNPDCHDCERVKDYIEQSRTFSSRPVSELTVLAVYPDKDLTAWKKAHYPSGWINSYDAEHVLSDKQLYDLKAIPTLYLLDKDKKVLLKDATVEQIEMTLQQIIR